MLRVPVLGSFPPFCCSLSLFLSDLLRVVGVVLVLLLIAPGLTFEAGVVPLTDGQLASGASLLCGGMVSSYSTVSKLSSPDA